MCQRLGAKLKVGLIPDAVVDACSGGAFWESGVGEFILRLPDTVSYRASQGSVVTISPAPGDSTALASSVFMGLPLAALLVQRHLLAISAAAVATPRGAVVLMGASGAGKSTMAISLALQGFPLLADGVVPVELGTDGTASVLPIHGPLDVAQDVLDGLAIPPERASRVREGIPRFRVSGVAWASDPISLCAVCLLVRRGDGSPKVAPMAGRHRVLLLLAHSFNRYLGEAPEVRQQMLADTARILQAVPVFTLHLPARGWTATIAGNLIREACELG